VRLSICNLRAGGTAACGRVATLIQAPRKSWVRELRLAKQAAAAAVARHERGDMTAEAFMFLLNLRTFREKSYMDSNRRELNNQRITKIIVVL